MLLTDLWKKKGRAVPTKELREHLEPTTKLMRADPPVLVEKPENSKRQPSWERVMMVGLALRNVLSS